MVSLYTNLYKREPEPRRGELFGGGLILVVRCFDAFSWCIGSTRKPLPARRALDAVMPDCARHTHVQAVLDLVDAQCLEHVADPASFPHYAPNALFQAGPERACSPTGPLVALCHTSISNEKRTVQALLEAVSLPISSRVRAQGDGRTDTGGCVLFGRREAGLLCFSMVPLGERGLERKLQCRKKQAYFYSVVYRLQ